jgi:transcriptional regulator with PAS, ATPase and Fis domain
MSSPRSSSQDLTRLFNSLGQPIAVLDDERRIVFVNKSCSEWLAVSPADIIGRIARYQSGGGDTAERAADSLCPPPEVLHGRRVAASITKPDDDSQSNARHAEFIPLRGDEDQTIGVLILLDLSPLGSDDKSTGTPIPTEDESLQLHEAVRRFRQEMAQSHHLDRLVGSSPAMARVRAQVKMAAAASGTVLLIGPLGIGREHVARTIHSAQSNAGAFLIVSCSALPAEQLRTTLTSLINRHGQPDATSVTTILLTDFHALPVEVQPELSRWLSAGPGSIRFMATSVEPANELVAAKKLRSDVAHLVSTLVIELPPLAERRDDIPLVAQLLLEDLNGRSEKQLRGFASEAMDQLVQYDWPGQVNELATIIGEAFEQAEGFEITATDLPKRLRQAAEAARLARPPAEPIDLEKFLAHVETELIERAMRQAKGNKTKAARLLGLNRPRLYRRMVQLGLEQGATDESEVADEQSE